MEISIKDIQDKFGTLSESLQLAIMDAKIDDRIMEIGGTHSLTAEQMGELSLDVHMLVLGFIQNNQFKDLVINSLKVDGEKAEKIVNDVSEKIIRKIRENMMNPEKEEGQKEEPTPAKADPTVKAPTPIIKTLKDDMQSFRNETPTKPEAIAPKDDDMLKKEWHLDKTPANLNPIAQSKMSGSFQIPQTSTEYAMKNISKSSNDAKDTGKTSRDPYREPIE